jgi:hypothetical protein
MENYTASMAVSSLPQMPDLHIGAGVLQLRGFSINTRDGRKEAVLLEAGLAERQLLVDGAPRDTVVAVLGGEQDGLAQLARWAAGHEGLDALHLVCHGAPGRLMLGARTLDRQALDEPDVQDALAAIGLSLGAGGAVLLYSCNVAEGAEGRAFVAQLALALGAPVAASAHVIGAGNWTLEHASAAMAVTPLAWPGYAPTLTIASTTTTFAGIGTGYYTAITPSGYAAGTVLSVSDIINTGWDVSAQSSISTQTFGIRGITGTANGDGDTTSLRAQAADIDYVIFKSNANGFYFDLTSFAIRNPVDSDFTVQAIDSSGSLVGSAVSFHINASANGAGAFTTISLAGNPDFVHVYGFKVNLPLTTDVPFFDNLIVANIGIPSLPTTVVSTAQLSADTNIAGDFVTSVAAQTIQGTLSAALVSGEKVQVSYNNGATWSDATSYSAGSSQWSTTTTLAGSSTFLARVANADGSTTPFSHSYSFDNTAPSAPSTPDLSSGDDSGALNTDNVTSTTTPTFTGTAESGSTITLYDTNGTTVLGTAAATGGNWSITSSALSQATHTLTVKSVDLAGNVSSASSPLSVTIDTTAPTSVALSANSATTSTAGSGATLATLSASDSTAVTYALATGNGSNDLNNGSFTISGTSLNVGGAALSAGTYKIYLSATDLAGNVSYLAQTITVNSVPSVTSIVRAGGAAAAVSGSAVSTTYTVNFSESVTGVDSSDFVLTATGTASGTVSAVTGSGGTYTVTVNGLTGDGTLRLDLKTSGTGIQSGASVAINGGYTSGQTYLLDHTAPAAPSTPDLATGDDSGGSSTDNITSVDQPSFSGSAESGSTVILYAGSTEIGRTTATGGAWTIVPTAPLSTGPHQITATATDVAGNVSAASAALSVNIDTAAPTSVALSTTSAAVATSTAGAAIATLSATDASAVTYALAVGNGTNDADNASFAISGNGLNVGGAALSAGTYHIYLSATDAAGNVSYLAQTITVQSVPVVTSIVRAGGGASGVAASATSTNYTVNFSESVTGVDISDFVLTASGSASGVIANVTGSGATYTVTVNSLAGDGTLRLDLKASGTGILNGGSVAIGGGYTSGASYLLDHTAPAAPSMFFMASADDSGSSNTDLITNVTTPTFSGTAAVGSTVTLYDGSTVLGTAVANGGVWSITSTTLATGTHGLTVKATDAAGNVSAASSTLTVTVDTTAAAPTGLVLASGSDSGVTGDGITRFATPTISGNGEAFAAITLYDSDGVTVIGTTTAGANGAWSIVVNTTLSDGPHALKAAQTDLAGNVSVLSTGLALTIDTQPPVAPGTPALDPASDTGTLGDNLTQTATPVIKGTAIANAVVNLYDTNGTTLLGSATADNAGNWSITSSTLSAGAHTLTAKQLDAAGNESAASVSLSLTIEAPPAPPTAPATVVDGVPVQTQSATLPGGGSGTQIIIPVVTPGRTETTGNANVADIPLATSGQGNILLAQVPAGFGLSAVGGVSQPAGDPLQQLIAAIVAATPGHTSGDQSHLTGNGVDFLSQLAQTTPLLVQTITPTANTTPSGTLTLTGTSSAVQRTALVIDTSHLPTGSKLALNAVDFAAIIGSADVSINSSGQVVSGDVANQTFTVAPANNSAIFAGGGSDTLVFGQQTAVAAAAAAAARAGAPGAASTTLLHGGLGNDVAVFAGNQSDYIIQQHEGYLLVAAKSQPSQQALVINAESLKFVDVTVALESTDAQRAIAGLYREVLQRQPDYLGFESWAMAQKSGASLGQIAIRIITSAESQAANPANSFNGNNSHDIDLLYQSLFGRHAEPGAVEFWASFMQQGASLENVATNMMTSAEMELHKIGVAAWDFLV